MKVLWRSCATVGALLLLGCANMVESFSFTMPGGDPVRLTEEPSRAAEEEGVLGPGDGSLTYRLTEPIDTPPALSIVYRMNTESVTYIVEAMGSANGNDSAEPGGSQGADRSADPDRSREPGGSAGSDGSSGSPGDRDTPLSVLASSRLPFVAGTAQEPDSEASDGQEGEGADTGPRMELRVPLPRDAKLHEIRVSRSGSPETTSPEGELRIVGLGATRGGQGVEFLDDRIAVHSGVTVTIRQGRNEPGAEWTISFADPSGAERAVRAGLRGAEDGAPLRRLRLSYAYEVPTGSERSDPVRLDLRTDSRTIEYRYRPRRGTRDLVFHDALYESPIRGVTVQTNEPGFALRSAYFESSSAPGNAAFEPIPIELGTVLAEYPRDAWRRPEFEVFSWSAYPGILVFDTASYAVQSALFKRLAFFVEKNGFAGELLSRSALAGRHGWNAHNYRADDLARFFNLAEAEGIRLTEEEEELRRILLDTEVIETVNGDYVAGKGGLISISRESYPELRALLLRHEALHGVYYAEPEYRDAVDRVWGALDSEEKAFWRLLLGQMTYDPANDYLMRNEFQAYLLQQRLDRVRGYLRGNLVPRLLRGAPDERARVEEFLRSHPQSFVEAARKLDAALRKTAGIGGGELISLVRIQ